MRRTTSGRGWCTLQTTVVPSEAISDTNFITRTAVDESGTEIHLHVEKWFCRYRRSGGRAAKRNVSVNKKKHSERRGEYLQGRYASRSAKKGRGGERV